MTACRSPAAGLGASMKRHNRKRSDHPAGAVSGSMADGFSSLPTCDRLNGLPSDGAALGP